MKIILASSSRYRQGLLQKLNLPFDAYAPDIDETPLADEAPETLVKRLAEAKAYAISQRYVADFIIGSDQIALHQGKILGKPLTKDRGIEQLSAFSGSMVEFFTSISLLDVKQAQYDTDIVNTQVQFRQLTRGEIENYIDREQPLDCAGSFKSEGMGIALFSSLHTTDPNALVGLPLIRLNQMLLKKGINGLLMATARG